MPTSMTKKSLGNVTIEGQTMDHGSGEVTYVLNVTDGGVFLTPAELNDLSLLLSGHEATME